MLGTRRSADYLSCFFISPSPSFGLFPSPCKFNQPPLPSLVYSAGAGSAITDPGSQQRRGSARRERTRMMSTLATAAFVLFLTHGALAVENGKTVINVDLYYEALCGDSVRFVKNQLVPSYPNLQEHLHVNFVPYGKATHRRDEETGRWSFLCQHGPAECRGNKAQACALDAIAGNEKTEDQQRLSVNLVGCVMSSTNPSTAVTRCGQTVGLSAATRRRISECEDSTTADDLLAAYGDKTYSLEPALSFVPTIVINGVYTSENQSAALSNFQRLICGLIPQDEKPAACPSS